MTCTEEISLAGSNFCRRCQRPLQDGEAVYGAKCWHRLRGPVAALQASGNPAAAKAADLLLTGGLVRLQGHGGRVFRAVSSDGSRTYLTSAWIQGKSEGQACNCKSGLYSKLCDHSVAAHILLAA